MTGKLDGAEKPKVNGQLTKIGLGVTAIWLVLGLIYLAPRLGSFWSLPLNEVGDFLAGGFAPLAFFWLVLGFFQQGEELRTSNRALWLQGEELRNSVEQQRELVLATREGIAAEADRLQEERIAAEERAKPMLELVAESWTGGGEHREQYLAIINHGEACTGLCVKIDEKVFLRRDMLSSGARADFSCIIPHNLIFEPIELNINYISKLKRDHRETFIISAASGQLITTKL